MTNFELNLKPPQNKIISLKMKYKNDNAYNMKCSSYHFKNYSLEFP